MAYRWLGTSYADADPARYRALVRKAYLVDPLDPSIHFHLSRAASFLGRYDEALAAARKLQPPQRDLMAGNIHHGSGHLDKALKSYYRAYRTEGNFGPLPRELIALHEYELAEAWVLEGKKVAPGSPTIAEVTLTFLRDEPEQAFRLWSDAAERRQDENTDLDLGWAHIRFSGDFEAARKALERFLLKPGEAVPRFDPDNWMWVIDYALALQRTGASERAQELIDETMAFIESQLAAGVVWGPLGFNLQVSLSALHAMSGNTQQVMAALRRASSQGGLTCTFCLRRFPHFDNVRDDPDFAKLVTEQEAKLSDQRQRLADEGMLLTPEQVLQLEEFSFDPFVN